MRRTVMVVLVAVLTTMAMAQIAAAERPPVWVTGFPGVSLDQLPPKWVP